MSLLFDHSMLAHVKRSFAVITLVIICTLSLVSTASAAEPDIARGEKLAQTCMGCHGAPGLKNPEPVYLIPMVGGQHADYIISALQAYKDKTRSHQTMQAQAANLSDQDMIDIAAYFNSFEENSRPSNVNQKLAEQGQQEAAICAACHGATGNGDNIAYPQLAGQYESYLIQALKDYRSGERENIIMAGFATNLTIEQIKALSAWFASQSGALSAPESTIFKFAQK